MCWCVALLTVVINVVIHAQAIHWVSNRKNRRVKINLSQTVFIMLCLIITHILEISIFAFGYQLILQSSDFGFLNGLEGASFTDYLYFSAVVFTTLGFGDIVPLGFIRLYVSVEALTGLSLIAWSMSSAFVVFQNKTT